MNKLVCEQHPKYRAIYKPRTDCVRCWIMYFNARKHLERTRTMEILEARSDPLR